MTAEIAPSSLSTTKNKGILPRKGEATDSNMHLLLPTGDAVDAEDIAVENEADTTMT